jgi:hypothetical protein
MCLDRLKAVIEEGRENEATKKNPEIVKAEKVVKQLEKDLLAATSQVSLICNFKYFYFVVLSTAEKSTVGC